MGDKLQLYVFVSVKTVATVLLVEKDKQHHPIYFVSHHLAKAEQRYELLERIAYTVLQATRKLRSYFDAHAVHVPTNQSLEKALRKLDTTSNLLKWAIKLSDFHIEYRPRITIKAQALVDSNIETTYKDTEEPAGTWQIVVDGSAAQTEAGADVVMISLKGDTFRYVFRFEFKVSNNKAE